MTDEQPFRKIIRARSVEYAVLDEVAFYEAVYSNGSVPNQKFYEIQSPFRMDSEVAAASVRKGSVFILEKKSRRKRRRGSFSSITDDLLQVSAISKKVLQKAVRSGAFDRDEQWQASSSTSGLLPDFNNRQARQLANKLASFSCPLSNYLKQELTGTKNIREVHLGKCCRIIDDSSEELVMWTNAESDVVTVECKGEEYIIPPFASFIVNHASASEALISQKKRFDFILLDPPWENRSVKRKRIYSTSSELTSVLDLCVPELMTENGLLAIWVTNNSRHCHFIDEVIEYFGCEKIATWRWLKVTKSGEPVYDMDSHHKQPIESIVFASSGTASKHYMELIVNNFLLISTPSAVHSRKPPLFPVLQALNILNDSAVQLELYGRYLLPQTTTIGFEAGRLQNKRYFV